MSELLVHIGFHKTGSTWLQNELFISGNSVFEPLTDKGTGHSKVAREMVYDTEGYLLSSYDLNTERIIAAVKDNLDKKGPELTGKVHVISHERLSGNPHSGGFDSRTIADRIKAALPQAKILVMFREQRSFILSNYFQYLSMGGTKGIEAYLNTPYDGRIPGFSPHHIQYHRLVSCYQSGFGSDRVLALPYEMFQNDPIQFIERLSAFVGREIQVSPERFVIRRNVKDHHFVNYHFRTLNLLRSKSSLNNHSFLANRLNRGIADAVIKALYAIVPRSLDAKLQKDLKGQISLWCEQRYSQSNRDLESLVELDLRSFGYS